MNKQLKFQAFVNCKCQGKEYIYKSNELIINYIISVKKRYIFNPVTLKTICYRNKPTLCFKSVKIC